MHKCLLYMLNCTLYIKHRNEYRTIRHVNAPCFDCEQLTAKCRHFHMMHGLQNFDSGKCISTIVWEIIKVCFNIGYALSVCFNIGYVLSKKNALFSVTRDSSD